MSREERDTMIPARNEVFSGESGKDPLPSHKDDQTMNSHIVDQGAKDDGEQSQGIRIDAMSIVVHFRGHFLLFTTSKIGRDDPRARARMARLTAQRRLGHRGCDASGADRSEQPLHQRSGCVVALER